MTKKEHPVVKGILFVLVLLCLLNMLAPVFTPKNALGNVTDEPDNTLDYIAFGDSECYTSISPMQLWQQHGFAGYNCGVSSQRIQDTTYLMEEILQKQKPRVILLETNLIFRTQGYKQEMQIMLDSFVGKLIRLYRYHSEWKNLIFPEQGVTNARNTGNVFKGMLYNTGLSPYTGGDYTQQTTAVRNIGTLQRIYLDNIRKLCQENDIQLVLYSAPSPICWSFASHNAVAAYAAEFDLSYIDLNLRNEELGIDWSTDTYDKGDHVNFSGAKKVTQFIGDYLKQNSSIPDRRADRSYDAWNDKLAAYLVATNQNPA